MSVLASIRNNFLGLAFLTVLLLPTVVRADYDVPGDTTKNINNYKGGSFFTLTTSGIAGEASGSAAANNNNTLYSPVETQGKLTDADVSGLKLKLGKGGSNLNPGSITKDNTYRVNTPNASLFYYRDATTGKDYLIAQAFKPDTVAKTAELYIFKQPLEKNSGDKNSVDTSTENGTLNVIDRSKNLPIRTTIDAKNLQYDLNQEKISADKELEEAKANLIAAQKARDDYRGSDQNDIQALDKAIADARAVRDGAEAKAKTAETNLNNVINNKLATQPVEQVGCGVTEFYKPKCIIYYVSILANIGFKIVSFVTYVVGTLFDYSLELSINSAELIKKLGVVEITWSFIRDVLNMSFIFILLWVAIQILLDSKDNYNARKVLTRVILVAIGINFSLFGAKLMVDGSNIVSLKIYESMKATSATGEISSISERVMNTVGLTTLYNFADIFSTDTVKSCSADSGAIITISVMGSIFLLIICLALGLAAILFLIRMVNIIFLFIKSPFWVWGYVLPGQKRIEKFKDDWWKEMMHVLTFPILYLFWMLVALIVFEKLGNVKNQVTGSGVGGAKGPSLIDLICQQNGGNNITTTISLVAIFAIVIIFLMKAVEHGIKNATSGAEGSFGADIAAAAGKKVSGYQTMLTKGLRDKAWNATKTVSVGSAKVPLRAVTGLTGGVSGLRSGKGFWKEGIDGYRNPSLNVKEAILNSAQARAAAGTGITSILAGRLAAKIDKPKNSAGETREDLEKRITAKAVKDQENRDAAIEKVFKLATQEEWLKKNDKKTVDDYRNHAEELMRKKAEALMGKDLMNTVDRRDADGRTHYQIMMANAFKDTIDADGKRTIAVNEKKATDLMMKALTYHTTGEGRNARNLISSKQRFEFHSREKALAKVKTLEAYLKKANKAAGTKEQIDNHIERLKSEIEMIQKLPTAEDLASDLNKNGKYEGPGENKKEIRKVTETWDDYAHMDPSKPGNTPEKIAKAKKAHERALADYKEHLEKQKSEIIKIQDRLDAKNKQKKEQEEADKK